MVMSSSQKNRAHISDMALHDFDVDTRTGFMPSTEPLTRLPLEWEAWEVLLDAAIQSKLQLGDKPGLSGEEKAHSREWRIRVREVATAFFKSAAGPKLLTLLPLQAYHPSHYGSRIFSYYSPSSASRTGLYSAFFRSNTPTRLSRLRSTFNWHSSPPSFCTTRPPSRPDVR
jgi:hypothetical protein